MSTGGSAGQFRFEGVFRSARPALVALVSRVLDDGEAEDVVQETFLKLSGHPVLERPDGEVTAWLRRVALNLAFNRARDVGRWKARATRGEGLVEAEPDPATAVERLDEATRVRALLDRLPVKQRDCLLLRHSGYSYAEIAETLELPKSSVGTTLARAERAFKDLYTREVNPS